MAVINWNDGAMPSAGDEESHSTAVVLELAATYRNAQGAAPVPRRLTAPRSPVVYGQSSVATRGDVDLGLIIDQTMNGDADVTATISTFPKTTVGPVSVKQTRVRYPFMLESAMLDGTFPSRFSSRRAPVPGSMTDISTTAAVTARGRACASSTTTSDIRL